MKQIVLISDTHHTLDERFIPHFVKADEIWHAGDIGGLEVTDQLKKYAPIRAVFGILMTEQSVQNSKKTFILNAKR